MIVFTPAPAACGRSGGFAAFQVGEPLLQHSEFLARPPQHRALHVELLARHEVEPRELRLQHALEVLFQVAPQGAHVLGDGAREAAGQVVDQSGVESHGDRGDRGRGA